MKETEIIIELEGLTQTIIQYTNNNYIRSYATKLEEVDINSQNDMFRLLVIKLADWYEEEIKLIMNNEFVGNKDAHMKSYELLKQWSNI
jgi:hypothetical protein